MKNLTLVWLALGLMAVAACSQGAGGQSGPLLGVTPEHRRHSGKAKLRIRIPHRHHRGKGGHYISASTKSIEFTVNGGYLTIANVLPTSPGCIVAGTPAYTQCTIAVTAPLGDDTFALSTYDGPNATGNQLSANTGVNFHVVSGSTTPLNVTLGGIAIGVSIGLTSSPGLVQPTPGTFAIYGHASYSFTILPIDADFNLIMGPGSPTIAITPPPGKPFAVSTPAAAAPNVWTFKSTYVATNPTMPSNLTLGIGVTPADNSGGHLISSSIAFQLYQPWIYVTNYYSSPPNAVGVFLEDGTVVPGVAAGFSHIPNPTGIAYDAANQWLYVPDGSTTNVVCVYDVLGNLISQTDPWTNVQYPQDITYAASNDQLYIANSSGMNPPGVTSYDGSGNQVPLTFPIPNPSVSPPVYAAGVAYDSHNNQIYVSDSQSDTLESYGLNGAPVTLTPISFVRAPAGVAYDSANNTIWVAVPATAGLNRRAGARRNHQLGGSSVLEFDEAGNPIALPIGAFSAVFSPIGILYDPYNDSLYIADASNDTIYNFDTQGNLIGSPSGFASGGSGVWGITLVP